MIFSRIDEKTKKMQLWNKISSFGKYPTASKKRAWKLYTSFGIVRVMVAHLEPLEQIRLQLANKFCYEIAVSRAQTIVQFDSTNLIFLNARKNCAYLFDS